MCFELWWSARQLLPWPKKEPLWWCIMWYRRICSLISPRSSMRGAAAVAHAHIASCVRSLSSAAESSTLIPRYHKILMLCISSMVLFAKLGERPAILDSHSDKVLKDFTDQKRDEKMYKKVPIFRCTTPSTGKRLGEVVVGTCTHVPTTTSPNLFPVDVVCTPKYRNFFVRLFVSLLVSKIL